MAAKTLPDSPLPPDEILLEGMRFYAFHEVNPEERTLGQRFTVDVALAVDLRPAGQSDDLHDTVAVHTCMTIRGIEKPGATMVTSGMRGGFRGRPETRAEFMALVHGGSR